MKSMFFLIMALICITVINAHGQDTTVYTVPSVFVTSSRSDDRLLDIPMAITVVPQLQLKSTRLYGFDDALSLVPGVLAQSRNGNQDVRVMIRGFGSRGAGQRSNAATTRGIRYYVDGIPETEPDGRTSFDCIDLSIASNIEVIRSNASALYGNASGGVISLSTKPTTNVPYISLQTSTGSFGLLKQSLQANTPLGNGSVTASFTNTMFDGWRQHSASSLQQGNVTLRTMIDSATSMNVMLVGSYNEFQLPGALTRSQYETDPQQAQNDPTVYTPGYVDRDERRINRLGRIGMTFDHTFSSEHSVTAMTFLQSKVLQRSERNTWRDFDRYHLGGNIVYHYTTAFNETSSMKLLVGIDEQYQDGAVRFYSLDLATDSRGTTLRDNKKEGANNLGLFIQDELVFNDLRATVGVRYDQITYRAENYINPSIDQTKTFTQVTPKLGFTWRVAPAMSVYANLGGGIEVPAFNEIDPPAAGGQDTVYSINPLLEPIRSTTYELGWKGTMVQESSWLRSVTYDVAAYYIDVRNDIIPYRDGRFYMTAGRTRRVGGELGLGLRTSFGVSVQASLNLMQNTYVNYTIDSSYINPSLAGKTVSYAGNDMAGVPSSWYSVQVRYDAPAVSGLYVLTEVRSVGQYTANDANTIMVDRSTVLDAAVGYDLPIGRSFTISTSLRCNNVADQRYMASAWVNPDTTPGGVPYIEPGMPRSLVFNLGIRWQ